MTLRVTYGESAITFANGDDAEPFDEHEISTVIRGKKGKDYSAGEFKDCWDGFQRAHPKETTWKAIKELRADYYPLYRLKEGLLGKIDRELADKLRPKDDGTRALYDVLSPHAAASLNACGELAKKEAFERIKQGLTKGKAAYLKEGDCCAACFKQPVNWFSACPDDDAKQRALRHFSRLPTGWCACRGSMRPADSHCRTIANTLFASRSKQMAERRGTTQSELLRLFEEQIVALPREHIDCVGVEDGNGRSTTTLLMDALVELERVDLTEEARDKNVVLVLLAGANKEAWVDKKKAIWELFEGGELSLVEFLVEPSSLIEDFVVQGMLQDATRQWAGARLAEDGDAIRRPANLLQPCIQNNNETSGTPLYVAMHDRSMATPAMKAYLHEHASKQFEEAKAELKAWEAPQRAELKKEWRALRDRLGLEPKGRLSRSTVWAAARKAMDTLDECDRLTAKSDELEADLKAKRAALYHPCIPTELGELACWLLKDALHHASVPRPNRRSLEDHNVLVTEAKHIALRVLDDSHTSLLHKDVKEVLTVLDWQPGSVRPQPDAELKQRVLDKVRKQLDDPKRRAQLEKAWEISRKAKAIRPELLARLDQSQKLRTELDQKLATLGHPATDPPATQQKQPKKRKRDSDAAGSSALEAAPVGDAVLAELMPGLGGALAPAGAEQVEDGILLTDQNSMDTEDLDATDDSEDDDSLMLEECLNTWDL